MQALIAFLSKTAILFGGLFGNYSSFSSSGVLICYFSLHTTGSLLLTKQDAIYSRYSFFFLNCLIVEYRGTLQIAITESSTISITR